MTAYSRSLLFIGALLALAVPGLGPAAAADAVPASDIKVRGGVHEDYDRLVVDWPRHVSYTVHRDGAHVVIDFGAPAQATWQDVIIARPTRASGFLSSPDKDGNLEIAFTINPRATIKDFYSGDSVVFDITGAAVGQNQSQAQATPAAPVVSKTPPSPVAASPEKPVAVKPVAEKSAPALTSPAADKSAASAAATAQGKALDQALPKPADAATASLLPALSPVAAGASLRPTPAGVVTNAPIDSAGNVVPSPATLITTTATWAPTTPAAPSAPTPSAPAPAAPTVTSVTMATSKNLKLPDLNAGPVVIVTLDPHTPSRAVIYQRGGYGYIVFDRKLTMGLDALTAGQPAPVVPLDFIDLPKASGYRFPLPPNVQLHATREITAWQIFLTREQPDVPVTASLVAQPDFALGARIILPLSDAPEPVHMTDPVIGDDLILVPLEQTQAFSVNRSMADFNILPAAQGLVIKPLIDKLLVRTVTDGIEITAEGGLHLSTANDTGLSQESAQKAKAAAAGKSMFDFAGWRGKPAETFTETRQRLQQTIVDVSEAERDRARLELARFYFAYGNGEEASALLDYLIKLVPDVAGHADFRALDGAAKILAWRPDDGLKDLDMSALEGQPEIELWQAVGAAELRDWRTAEPRFAISENLLVGYPEPFYSRFSLLAIESALAVGKDHEAADWLDRLETSPHSANVNVPIDYLHGILDAKAGHAEKAEQEWKDVAASNDNLYRVRARLALIDLGVSTRSLTPAQAADQLESLRFAWRGDDLELDILHRLGGFYIDAHNVKAGLNTLARAIQLYPNSPMTPEIHQEMQKMFRDVFLSDPQNALSPLDALTLYQQYRDLMPAGDDGIAVTRNLAERLVQVDLLDQAASLLDDLVKNKLQGEEKGRVSARLAAIRLLNHDPDKAIAALDMANATTYPADLQNERTLLRSRALSEAKKYDDALALIKDNGTRPAMLLRADIFMHAQRWNDASEALLALVGPPPPQGQHLTQGQAGLLLNCAIAVALAGDNAGLNKLYSDYSASVNGLPQNDTFLMLTEPEKSEESHDIAAAQAKIADVDLFQGFLDTYRKEGTVTSVDSASPMPDTGTPSALTPDTPPPAETPAATPPAGLPQKP